MNLRALCAPLRDLPAYRALLESLRAGGAPGGALHLPRAARPAVVAALAEDLGRPLILLTARGERWVTLGEELPAWAPGVPLHLFPDPRPLFYERAHWGPRAISQRAAALAALAAGQHPTAPPPDAGGRIVLAGARAAITRTLARRDLLSASRALKVGAMLRLDQALQALLEAGYQPASLVTEPGQISHRGGILDLWPPAEPLPVRVELFGDQIDSMRRFNPATQRSSEAVPALWAAPAREGLPRLYRPAWDAWLLEGAPEGSARREALLESALPLMNPGSGGLLDFAPPEALIVLDDRAALEAAVGELEEQAVAQRAELERAGLVPTDFPLPYVTWSELREALDDRAALDLGMAGEARPQGEPDLAGAFVPGPRLGGQIRPLLDHLGQRLQRHETTVVLSRQAPRLAELWGEHGAPRPSLDDLPPALDPGGLYFVQGALSEGFELRGPGPARLHLLSDAEIFGWGRPRPRPPARAGAPAPEAAFADLHPRDWVVHTDYGVGRFQGLVERTLDGLAREYLLVEYAEGDQLYVPIHQADRLTRYVGVDEAPPAASRLGTAEWERVKSRAREAAEQVARELLELYARRMAARGHAFAPDTAWQAELEASFPYVETEDQLRALEAVKQDMEHRRPMDRLICGDVGYGKTEVALRAAFKAVMDGRQVAMLVPTTILAQQHFDTFRQRLAAFPVQVEMLSRFRTRAESEAILRRLAAGEIDILIGTHRLLQNDVAFNDLGLVVIDEEQRFGVTHKEHLKRLRTEVDVLTLTATPIPRTLYMAVTGVRDISVINTPPEERLPVVTHVGPYDPRLVRQAVLRELDRDGQVFFVHNRVQTIHAMRERLERLLPEARVAVAHGQVPERELAQVMERFNAAEVDVLLSTSIIESGLDIPNANTLIVDRADTFGLSQLYQLRGRVGRGAARAYAYFFRNARGRPTPEAQDRLETLAEHTELGAGYSIAMRDLELRGAGDLLGTRQHGHIAAVGFHLYTRLLAQAVRRLKGAAAAAQAVPAELPPISIDLPLPSAIPADYVADRDLRLQLYRRMAETRGAAELETLAAELADRFGPPPPEVDNLLYQLRVRLLCHAAGAEGLAVENGQVLIGLPADEGWAEGPSAWGELRRSKRGLWLPLVGARPWQERLVEALERLASERRRVSAAGDGAR